MLVDGVEEGERVAGVDEHRQAEVAGVAHHLDDARVVGGDQGVAVAHPEAEVLPDLDPAGAAGAAVLERALQRTDTAGLDHPVPVELAEGREPPLVRGVVALDVGGDLLAPHPVEVDHRGDAAGVHGRDERPGVGDHPGAVGPVAVGEPAPEVVVHVDRVHRGPRHGRLGHPHPRPRVPVDERHPAQRVPVRFHGTPPRTRRSPAVSDLSGGGGDRSRRLDDVAMTDGRGTGVGERSVRRVVGLRP